MLCVLLRKFMLSCTVVLLHVFRAVLNPAMLYRNCILDMLWGVEIAGIEDMVVVRSMKLSRSLTLGLLCSRMRVGGSSN